MVSLVHSILQRLGSDRLPWTGPVSESWVSYVCRPYFQDVHRCHSDSDMCIIMCASNMYIRCVHYNKEHIGREPARMLEVLK